MDRFDAPARATPAAAAAKLPLLTFQDILWFLYLYPIRILSALIPARLLYPLGRLAQMCAPRRTDDAERRIRSSRCPQIPPEQARRIAAGFLANSAFRMLDDLALSWPSSARRLKGAEVVGLEHLEQARAAGQGVVLLTTHFCAGHAAKRYLASAGYPVISVRDQFLPGDWWGRFGRRFLAPRRLELLNRVTGPAIYRRELGSALKILNTLRSGGLVGIHFDGRSGARTTTASFLGVPRQFSTGMLDVVRLSGCAVVPVLPLGRSSSLRIVIHPMLTIAPADDRDEFIRLNLSTFVRTIEQQIADHPEEWEQWMTF